MKNEELDRLQESAERVHGMLSKLYVNDEGQFIRIDEQGQRESILPGDMLKLIGQARREAAGLMNALRDEPRRKGTSRKKGDD